MKITKKDKIVLLTLFFVLIIGVFVMYGFIPANNELKETEKKYNELKAEVDKLNVEYMRNDPTRLNRAMEEALMNYYLDNTSGVVMAKDDFEAFYNPVYGFDVVTKAIEQELGDGVTFTRPSVSKSNIKTESVVVDSDFISKKSVQYLIGTAVFNYEYDNLDGFEQLLTRISGKITINGVEQTYQYRNVSFKIEKVNGKVTGTIEITKLYAKTPEKMPAPLVNDPSNFKLEDLLDAPKKPIIDKDEKSLTFKAIDYASYYEIYKVKMQDGEIVVDENGNPTYTLVKSDIKPKEADDAVVVLQNYDRYLSEDEYYVLAAVGNYQTAKEGKLYYRTIMSKYLLNNKFTINQ